MARAGLDKNIIVRKTAQIANEIAEEMIDRRRKCYIKNACGQFEYSDAISI